jgi:hypothetical protein
MNKNVKPVTPRCGICNSFYSSRDDDGSGLCLKCRPKDSQPLLNVKRQLKQTFVMEVGKIMMDDFDKEELNEQQEGVKTEEMQEKIESSNPSDGTEVQVIAETPTGELKIEDIIEPGRYGISNSQMIPALKKAIAEKSLEKLALLKKSYLYTYNKSIRYLKKSEREFIANNDI